MDDTTASQEADAAPETAEKPKKEENFFVFLFKLVAIVLIFRQRRLF